jgi:hypothetical protein
LLSEAISIDMEVSTLLKLEIENEGQS